MRCDGAIMSTVKWQMYVFAGVGLGVAILFAFSRPDLSMQVAILAPLVAILGLPHGALDLRIAEMLLPLGNARKKFLFVLGYLGLSGGVIAVWSMAPAIALLAFLCCSVVHFSDDWASEPLILRWSGGLATIGAPALVHQGEVETIFAVLSPARGAAMAAEAGAFAGAVALGMLIVSVLTTQRGRGSAIVEQTILWTVALALPPLIYFAVYFCALHSVRHLMTTMNTLTDGRRALIVAMTLSAFVTAAALLALRQGYGAETIAVTEQGIGIIFIGLAALTVPHMILVDRFHQR